MVRSWWYAAISAAANRSSGGPVDDASRVKRHGVQIPVRKLRYRHLSLTVGANVKDDPVLITDSCGRTTQFARSIQFYRFEFSVRHPCPSNDRLDEFQPRVSEFVSVVARPSDVLSFELSEVVSKISAALNR